MVVFRRHGRVSAVRLGHILVDLGSRPRVFWVHNPYRGSARLRRVL